MLTVTRWQCHVQSASEGGGKEIDKAKYMSLISISDDEAVCKRSVVVLRNYIRLPAAYYKEIALFEKHTRTLLTNVISELLLRIISHEIKQKKKHPFGNRS
jgi:hypothetical protein